jgi:surface protein
MFGVCKNLESINLESFNTTAVKNMASMFLRCGELKKLNLSSFDTTGVYDMNSMFDGCESLAELDISKFNMENVVDVGEMFHNCRKLRVVVVPAKLDVSEVECGYLFSLNCPNPFLKKLRWKVRKSCLRAMVKKGRSAKEERLEASKVPI